MTFQQLTYVVEISKCGSINKAAHKLFLSQSGISTAVRELEEELGIRFFVRSNRGVEFTPAGKEFLGYAVSLLEQKQRIERLYGEAAPRRRRCISAYPPSAIPLRRTPFWKCSAGRRITAISLPSRKPAWMASSTMYMTTGRTSA